MKTIQSALIGVRPFNKKNRPKPRQDVLWIWDAAGLITAGNYVFGKALDASNEYKPIPKDLQPTHWMPWPENWA